VNAISAGVVLTTPRRQCDRAIMLDQSRDAKTRLA
jgi:hypothetical protein